MDYTDGFWDLLIMLNWTTKEYKIQICLATLVKRNVEANLAMLNNVICDKIFTIKSIFTSGILDQFHILFYGLIFMVIQFFNQCMQWVFVF